MGRLLTEMLRKRKPDISYFRIFGCPVYVLKNRDKLGKFQEKAEEGLFLGYSRKGKAYKYFSIPRQTVDESIHMTFEEEAAAINSLPRAADFLTLGNLFPDLPAEESLVDALVAVESSADRLAANESSLLVDDPLPNPTANGLRI